MNYRERRERGRERVEKGCEGSSERRFEEEGILEGKITAWQLMRKAFGGERSKKLVRGRRSVSTVHVYICYLG
jgi:hypothetical protein